uniref:Uncharacterized protein n=1 Tax=Cacopsylla melanoneura TaxID=428564 RepID=A0A8D9EK65_9HEMI
MRHGRILQHRSLEVCNIHHPYHLSQRMRKDWTDGSWSPLCCARHWMRMFRLDRLHLLSFSSVPPQDQEVILLPVPRPSYQTQSSSHETWPKHFPHSCSC